MSSPLLSLTRAQGSLIQSLLTDKKVRTKEGAFVVEGAKSCLDLIRQHPDSILSVTLSPRYLQTEGRMARTMRSKLSIRQFTCSDSVFGKLSDVEAPQGILAVVRQPQWNEEQIWGQARVLGLYGEQLQDPANVGAIIRTTAALNLTGLWLSSDSADCFSPKVVRSAAGAVLTLPIFRTARLQTFSERHCSIYAAVVPSPETVPLRTIREIPHRVVIAVGNEGRGLTPELLKASNLRFSIPLAEEVESLNVAATVAISAFYFSGLPAAP